MMPEVGKTGEDGLEDFTQLGNSVEAAKELTLQEIYERLCVEEDIILVIDAVEQSRVRKGLSGIKAKQNAKLKDNDLPIDTSTLEFVLHEDKDLAKLHRVKLQIFLKRPATVKVHSLIVADGEL